MVSFKASAHWHMYLQWSRHDGGQVSRLEPTAACDDHPGPVMSIVGPQRSKWAKRGEMRADIFVYRAYGKFQGVSTLAYVIAMEPTWWGGNVKTRTHCCMWWSLWCFYPWAWSGPNQVRMRSHNFVYRVYGKFQGVSTLAHVFAMEQIWWGANVMTRTHSSMWWSPCAAESLNDAKIKWNGARKWGHISLLIVYSTTIHK